MPEAKLTTAPAGVLHQIATVMKERVALFGGDLCSTESQYAAIVKASEEARSRQGVKVGRQDHPFELSRVANLQTVNEHHSTCIHTKVAALVGLGYKDGQEEVVVDAELGTKAKVFKESKVDEVLDPLCDISWADVNNDAAEDFEQTGNGYIEAVRQGPAGPIVGLSHLPAKDTYVYVEDSDYNYHYEIVGEEGAVGVRRFARFGDSDAFLERGKRDNGSGLDFQVPEREVENDNGLVSEVIHFRRPTSLSRWYGFPDWIAAVPAIELGQMLMQYKYDFFVNRGVPEFMLFLLGQQLHADDWKKVEDAMKANIGIGNAFKSIALNLDNPEVKVQLEKLALEGKSEDTFAANKEALALAVVTAHRVPPLLAGIQIPGKLGATNELPNALMAFQILVMGPRQRLWQRTLGKTLASEDGVPGLTVKDFAPVKITEEINIGSMDTVARMRQSPAQAEAEGRDLKDGVKE